MTTTIRRLSAPGLAAALMVVAGAAFGQTVLLPKGTEVPLVFDAALSSRTAKVGERVPLHVSSDVKIGSQTVIREGTKASGVITKVDKRKRFGVNARMFFAVEPIRAINGASVPLDMRQKGKVAGNRAGEAVAASAGGALVLGPVGLVGGYFVVGKPVNIKPGDPLVTEVSRDVSLRLAPAAH